jgi:sterol desaturase/sphingolipid hydroxylase (fatty acid hydroxylase superfamily)
LPNEQHPGPDRRSSRRERLLTPGFNLTRHLCLFAAMTAAALAFAAGLARRARAVDLWVIPAYLVLANATEYLMHRLLMHRPLWPRKLYEGHTLCHHRAFHHDSMEIDSWRELDLVMMPWISIAIFFAALAPLALGVAAALGRGAAGLMIATAIATFTAYEGMHALYHLPRRTLGRLGLLRSRLFVFLYRHHRHHHRLSRMRWTNFNISMPLADRLLGTLEGEAAWRAARARRLAATESATPPDRADDDADPEAA